MTDASSKPSHPLRRWLLAAWRAYVEPYRRQREVMAFIEEIGGEDKTELGGTSWFRGLPRTPLIMPRLRQNWDEMNDVTSKVFV